MSGLLILLARAINLYILIIFIRVLMSWFQPNPYNPLVNFLYRITDPLLDAVRRAFPFLVVGGMDLSPIAVFFLLQITQRYIVFLAFKLS